eukprot:TRINITY_DN1707_c0_g1_i1.p1 TRINITY_DN1707_c0_g1~~TRINITY_DN1707_c0_g1_i1.p1  ORF type:complete len:573 (+),score=173.51 TRINITY_DN1707_c0_g1_i1:90-1721(+)
MLPAPAHLQRQARRAAAALRRPACTGQLRTYNPTDVDKHPLWQARLVKIRDDNFPTLSPAPRTPDPGKSKELVQSLVAGHSGPPPSPPRSPLPAAALQGAASGPASRSPATDPVMTFDLRPREVSDHLDRHVIGQQHAKRVLSIAICDHYHHARACLTDPEVAATPWTKPNVLLIGPTGVGKTHLLRVLTRLVGVPMVVTDATKLSATGYVGGDAEDCVRSLLAAAGGSVARAQHGVVYLDEVDKIAQPRGLAAAASGAGVNTRDVQNTLLKLMEDGSVRVTGSSGGSGGGGPAGQTLSTKHILFIASGAFNSLQHPADGAASVDTAALVAAGLEPEFVGRLPVRVALHALSEADLVRVLHSAEDSVLRQATSQFARYGIEIQWEEDALLRIAQLASSEGTGARGLVTVLERVLSPLKFELPSTPVRELRFTRRFVESPEEALRELVAGREAEQRRMLHDDVGRFEAAFRSQTGRRVEVSEEARERVVAAAEGTGRTVHHLLWRGCGDALLRKHKDEAALDQTPGAEHAPAVIGPADLSLPSS